MMMNREIFLRLKMDGLLSSQFKRKKVTGPSLNGRPRHCIPNGLPVSGKLQTGNKNTGRLDLRVISRATEPIVMALTPE